MLRIIIVRMGLLFSLSKEKEKKNVEERKLRANLQKNIGSR